MAVRFRLNGHFRSGPSYKVALMLALAGEPFAYHLVDLVAGEQRAPDYLKLARFGQVPCLEDLSNGRALVQSAAILDYLADRIGKFGGATYDERLAAREWLFWDFDRLAPGVFRTRRHELGVQRFADEVVAEYRSVAAGGLSVLDEHLKGRDFVVGDGLTIADIDLYGVVSLCDEAKIDLAPYPQVVGWMRRIEALPGFVKRQELLAPERQTA